MRNAFLKHFDLAEKYNLPMLFVERNADDDFVS
jgi:Tat protein secretion system quality control protein TatD with DNase activity